MRDVASTAGVSLKTVSRVVNSEDGVRPATAARVEAAIAQPWLRSQRRRTLAAPRARQRARARDRGRRQPVLLGHRAHGRGRRPRAQPHPHHRLVRGGRRARARARPAPAAPVGRRPAHRPRRRRPPLPAARDRRRDPDRLPRPPAAGRRGRHRAARQPSAAPARRSSTSCATGTSGSPTSATCRRSTPPPSAWPATAPRCATPGCAPTRAWSAPARTTPPPPSGPCARCSRSPPTAGPRRSSPPTTATRSARCARCATATGRSRSSASTTSSWPTCSPCPSRSSATIPRRWAASAPRWPTSGSTARTGLPPAAHHRLRGRGPRLRGAARAMTAAAAKLPPNPIRHFYRGGPAIAELRGIDVGGDHSPEEWIGSASTLFGEASAGSAACPTARWSATPWPPTREAWLGADHVARFGASPALLVKLLDAGERLPVHHHPDGVLRARAPRPGLRQDRGVDRRRGAAGRAGRRRLARGRRPSDTLARVGRRPGPRRAARRAAPARGQRGRRDLRPRRRRPRDRRRAS